MPNWCQGSIKVRGKYEDVVNFFTERVGYYKGHYVGNTYVDRLMPKEEWLEIHEDEDTTELYYLKYYNYIKGTQRAFLTNDREEVFIQKHEDKLTTAYGSVVQAWDFSVDDWVKLSKITHLQFKLYGIEMGAGFMHEIEVNDGEIIEDDAVSFDDYDKFVWNCPFPWMGG